MSTTMIKCQSCGTVNRVDVEKISKNPVCGECGTVLEIANTPVAITDETFNNEVINASMPVLVDFWAPWCGPCRIIAPVLEELAAEYAGRVKIAKVNTDENQMQASQRGIRGIPTLILFKDGTEFDRIVGAAPKQHFQQLIDRALN